MIYKLPRLCNYRVKLQLCWPSLHRFTIMPDEILAFHFMLFSRSHVWKENFEAPLTSLTRVIMPSLSGYTLLLRAVYLVSRGIWQRHENTVARWLTESAITPRILARTCRTVSVCVSRLYTHVARKPVAGLKVHVSHPHRNGLVLRARRFITLLLSRISEGIRAEIEKNRDSSEQTLVNERGIGYFHILLHAYLPTLFA